MNNQVIKTDRSRIESLEKCAAYRFWSYEFQSGTEGADGVGGVGGIERNLPILPLVVGSAVHKGLETLLTGTIDFQNGIVGIGPIAAVRDAINEFASRLGDFRPAPPSTALGSEPLDLADGELPLDDLESGPSLYQVQEGLAISEALVRVYASASSGLEWLLSRYEVVSVEEEIEVNLGSVLTIADIPYEGLREVVSPVILMSRPDGVLRSRLDHRLYALSFKTAKELDSRTLRQLKYDNQGIAEMLAIESKYGEMCAGVQMVYLLKGASRKDEGDGSYKSSSPLIRPYFRSGMTIEDSDFAPAWNWVDESGKKRTMGKGFKRANIWEPGQIGIVGWLERLAREYPRVFEEQVVNLPVIYRNPQDVRRWLVGNYQREILVDIKARAVNYAITTTTSVEEKLDVLDREFPMNRKSCVYPSPCPMIPVCFEGVGAALLEGADVGDLGWRRRTPNHPTEISAEAQA